MIRPAEDLALYRAEMADWAGRAELRDWQESTATGSEANDACRRDILDRLDADGPLPSRELPDTCEVPWRSSGWNNNRNVAQLLEFMVQRGEVAVAGRQGRERLWDLAARVYPDDPVVPADEALRDPQRDGGCARWASPGPAARSARSSRPTSARPASPPWSRASAASGGSTPRSSASRSPGGPRCCRRSTGWSTTASG